jgi:cell division protein FtsX
VASLVGNDSPFTLNKLMITPHEAMLTGVVVVLVGALVGALGSAFAVRRFLAV